MEHTLDHVSVHVTDYERSKKFYEAALAPLGIKLLMEFGKAGGFGRTKPELWIGEGKASFQTEAQAKAPTPVHVCVAAKKRADVEAFHRAALDAGGRDFGAPGLRPQYHPGYYAAFVLDPDGHDIEAVVHGPDQE